MPARRRSVRRERTTIALLGVPATVLALVLTFPGAHFIAREPYRAPYPGCRLARRAGRA